MASYLSKLHKGQSVPDWGQFQGGNWLLPLKDPCAEIANLDASSSKDQITAVAKKHATTIKAVNQMKAAISGAKYAKLRQTCRSHRGKSQLPPHSRGSEQLQIAKICSSKGTKGQIRSKVRGRAGSTGAIRVRTEETFP